MLWTDILQEHKLINVLIVDNQKKNRSKLKSNLTQIGLKGKKIQVDSIKSAIEVLEHHEDHRDAPEIIFTDIVMKDEKGVDLLIWVRNNSHYKNTPIIILSEQKGVQHVCEAIAQGADEYVQKPFDKQKITQALIIALGKKAKPLD